VVDCKEAPLDQGEPSAEGPDNVPKDEGRTPTERKRDSDRWWEVGRYLLLLVEAWAVLKQDEALATATGTLARVYDMIKTRPRNR
jgi:hypothetical protein